MRVRRAPLAAVLRRVPVELIGVSGRALLRALLCFDDGGAPGAARRSWRRRTHRSASTSDRGGDTPRPRRSRRDVDAHFRREPRGKSSQVSAKSSGRCADEARVSSWVLPMIIGIRADCGRRVRIERMTRERAIVEHGAEVERAAADDGIGGCQCRSTSRSSGIVRERRRALGVQLQALRGRPARARSHCSGPDAVSCWPLIVAARWNRPARRRHRHQRGDLRAAAGLAEHHDVARVAAELGDVVAHPAQRQHQVEHAGVAGVREIRADRAARGRGSRGRQADG